MCFLHSKVDYSTLQTSLLLQGIDTQSIKEKCVEKTGTIFLRMRTVSTQGRLFYPFCRNILQSCSPSSEITLHLQLALKAEAS